jgi:hypothetical protein
MHSFSERLKIVIVFVTLVVVTHACGGEFC